MIALNTSRCRFVISISAAFAVLLAVAHGPLAAQDENDQGAVVVEQMDAVQDEIDAVELEDEELAVQVVGNPWGVETGQLRGAKQFQLKQVFRVEIEQLQRVCELDQRQTLKLRIGAKGAVKKLTAAWDRKMAQQMGQFGDQAQPAKDNSDEPEEVTFEDADEIDGDVIQMMTMDGFSGNPYKSDDPIASRFWTKTVANVLSKPQLEALKQFKQERQQAKRMALVDYTVAAMRLELALTREQTERFDEIIRPVLMKAEIDCVVLYEPYLVYYYASKSDNAEIAKLLSPSQLQKWKLFMAPMKQIGEVMEMEDADFGIVAEDDGGVVAFVMILNAVAEAIDAWLGNSFELK